MKQIGRCIRTWKSITTVGGREMTYTPKTVEAVVFDQDLRRNVYVTFGVLDYDQLDWPQQPENADFDSGIYYYLTPDEYENALTTRDFGTGFEILEIEITK
jgi:hypothetical protein